MLSNSMGPCKSEITHSTHKYYNRKQSTSSDLNEKKQQYNINRFDIKKIGKLEWSSKINNSWPYEWYR